MPESRRDQLRHAMNIGPNPTNACPQPPLLAFEKELHAWAMGHCVFRDGCWGGVAGLHLDYVRWCQQRMDVPCSLMQFREWLRDNNFYLHERGLVYGLILGVDDAYRSSRLKLVVRLTCEDMERSATQAESKADPGDGVHARGK